MFRLLFEISHIRSLYYFLVEWKNIDYNVGNYFDGKNFVAPVNGLYSFTVFCRHNSSGYSSVVLYLNGEIHTFAPRATSSNGFVNIYTTLKLVTNDKLNVRFEKDLYRTDDERTTYFEGRLIARLDE